MRPARTHRSTSPFALLLTLALFGPATPSAIAQDRESTSPSFVSSVLKGVALDPTTYAPALITYNATLGDWNSSQVFFAHGFIEGNSRFTVSGFANDFPVSYDEGANRILVDAFGNLRRSLVNNVSSRIVEHFLLKRFPNHPRAVKTLGWIQRTAIASYTTYIWSEPHWHQWRTNNRMAQQLGY